MRDARRLLCALVVCCATAGASAADDAAPVAAATAVAAESLRLEGELQHLAWPQFRSVIEAIPQMKADVEAYGPIGWKYVEANYRTHRWRKNIGRLDAARRDQLEALIRKARGDR